MKKIKFKLSTFLSFVCATALGAMLFWVSQQVQQLEHEQREIREVISSENEGMRVLSAEWDYLNRPERIEALADRYLNTMAPVAPENLLRDANAVPEPQIMQGEDDAPVLVSTGDQDGAGKTKKKVMSTAPDSRPIHDDELNASDFNNVLDQTMGSDE
jgi:hypothetical protein